MSTIMFETEEKKDELRNYLRSLSEYDSQVATIQESRKDYKKSMKERGILSKDEYKYVDKAYSLIMKDWDKEELDTVWDYIEDAMKSRA